MSSSFFEIHTHPLFTVEEEETPSDTEGDMCGVTRHLSGPKTKPTFETIVNLLLETGHKDLMAIHNALSTSSCKQTQTLTICDNDNAHMLTHMYNSM